VRAIGVKGRAVTDFIFSFKKKPTSILVPHTLTITNNTCIRSANKTQDALVMARYRDFSFFNPRHRSTERAREKNQPSVFGLVCGVRDVGACCRHAVQL